MNTKKNRSILGLSILLTIACVPKSSAAQSVGEMPTKNLQQEKAVDLQWSFREGQQLQFDITDDMNLNFWRSNSDQGDWTQLKTTLRLDCEVKSLAEDGTATLRGEIMTMKIAGTISSKSAGTKYPKKDRSFDLSSEEPENALSPLKGAAIELSWHPDGKIDYVGEPADGSGKLNTKLKEAIGRVVRNQPTRNLSSHLKRNPFPIGIEEFGDFATLISQFEFVLPESGKPKTKWTAERQAQRKSGSTNYTTKSITEYSYVGQFKTEEHAFHRFQNNTSLAIEGGATERGRRGRKYQFQVNEQDLNTTLDFDQENKLGKRIEIKARVAGENIGNIGRSTDRFDITQHAKLVVTELNSDK